MTYVNNHAKFVNNTWLAENNIHMLSNCNFENIAKILEGCYFDYISAMSADEYCLTSTHTVGNDVFTRNLTVYFGKLRDGKRTGWNNNPTAIIEVVTLLNGNEICKNVQTENINCWFVNSVEFYLNDWAEFPDQLNEIETLIASEIERLNIKPGNVHVKLNADDSLRVFSLTTMPYAVNALAKKIYENFPACYRDKITGCYLNDFGYLYFNFSDNEFENATKEYCTAKADWCSKYGCD